METNPLATGPHTPAPLFYSLHSVFSYEAVLLPTPHLTRLAGHLPSLPTLLNEVTCCCIPSMNEHDDLKVLRWDNFTQLQGAQVTALPNSSFPVEESLPPFSPAPASSRPPTPGAGPTASSCW